MPSDAEQRQHWREENRYLRGIAKGVAVIGAGLIAGGIWVGTQESRLSMVEDKEKVLSARIDALQERTRSAETSAARVDERLINQGRKLDRQDEKLERILEMLSGRYALPRDPRDLQ